MAKLLTRSCFTAYAWQVLDLNRPQVRLPDSSVASLGRLPPTMTWSDGSIWILEELQGQWASSRRKEPLEIFQWQAGEVFCLESPPEKQFCSVFMDLWQEKALAEDVWL